MLVALTDRIEALLSQHATSLHPERKTERYRLVSRVSHVGVALWVFARKETTAGRLGKPLHATVGLWRLGMGNKGAVGVRVPLRRGKEDGWETFTFVAAHLEAHDGNVARRNAQYEQILASLVFYPGDALQPARQPHESSHLFIMGDLNYRLEKLPGTYPKESIKGRDTLALEKERAQLVPLDTLKREQRAGRVFGGMREGDLACFAPTYKRIVGQVEGYSQKRIPGWTDRILFASHTDTPELYTNDEAVAPATTTQVVEFGSTPELVISDHKPVHAILTLPPVEHHAPSPVRAPVIAPPPAPHRARPAATSREEIIFWKVIGTLLDRLVGWSWTILVLLGFGNEKAGMGVGAFLAMVWSVWWTGILANYLSL